MNGMLVMVTALLFLVTVLHYSTAQPLCGGDMDLATSKLCLTVLEELLRRNHLESEYPDSPQRARISSELLDNGLPFVDRGAKRQDVDHVFLRFGR